LPAYTGSHSNSESSQNHPGLQSINWDFALSYTTVDNSGALFDTTSLLPSSSSSAALTGDLLAPDPSFHTTPDWNLFPNSDSHYLGDDTQLLPGGPTLLSTAEHDINTLTMPSGMGNINSMNTSAQMTRGKDYAPASHHSVSNLCRLLTIWVFLYKPQGPELIIS
jgi:hypothetical protein